MSDIGQPERATQDRVLSLFRDELKYRFLGDWTDRANSNIEEDLLSAWLSLAEADAPPSIELKHNRMLLRMRPGSNEAKRQDFVEEWYRARVRAATADLVAHWAPKIGVHVTRFFVQRMKTRWGSCNSRARTIRLNTDLAKKPRECLEYIVVHEMLHILEPTHNERFQQLMSSFMPDWLHRRQVLNRLPVRHEDWQY